MTNHREARVITVLHVNEVEMVDTQTMQRAVYLPYMAQLNIPFPLV